MKHNNSAKFSDLYKMDYTGHEDLLNLSHHFIMDQTSTGKKFAAFIVLLGLI